MINKKVELLNDIFIICEQIGALFPGQRKPDYYINPLLQWMTDEWKIIKKLIAKNLLDIASGKITKEKQFALVEERAYSPAFSEQEDIITFSTGQRGLMSQLIGLLTGRIISGTKERTKAMKRQATIDAGGWFQARTQPTTILLSREGLDAVVAGLAFQEDFVDDLTLNTQTRIDKLLQARYGTLTDFSQQVDHALRISRDDLLDAFHLDVNKIADRVRNGIITPEKFQDEMMESIRKNYRKIYRQAKGSPLNIRDEGWIKLQVETQRQYLDNFRNLLNQKIVVNDELTSYVNFRAGLYAERGSSIYERAVVNTWPEDVLIDWRLGVAEHCVECPILAQNSPYMKQTLPKIPGDGSTLCGTSCKCYLAVSDLYILE